MKFDTKNRQQLLVILAGIAVLLLVLDSVVLTPMTKSWKSRAAEIERLQKNVTQGRGLIERGDRMQSLWAEMQSQALPKDAAEAEQALISAFDRWGRSASIEVGSIKPQWKRGATDRYSLLECRVDATGTLATLTKFVYEVEHSKLPLRIESIELTARDTQGQRLSLSLHVSGLRLAPLERKS